MDCEKCKENVVKRPETIPYIVYEAETARKDLVIKRLIIALTVSIVIFIGSVFALNERWIRFMEGYDFESYELYADGTGNASFIGNDGEIINNGSTSEREAAEEEESENR